MGIKKIEIYRPLFLEFLEFEQDMYWIELFKDLSKSKTPVGVYFYNNCICFKGKPNNTINLSDYSTSDYRTLYEDIIDFLKNVVKLKSPSEKENDQLSYYIDEQKIKDNIVNWSDIKKKKTKDILIELFSIKMKQKFSLSVHQTRNLISSLAIKIAFKHIQGSDINIIDGEIETINGLMFEKKKFFFENDQIDQSIQIQYHIDLSEFTENNPKNMIELWLKHLSDVEQRFDF